MEGYNNNMKNNELKLVMLQVNWCPYCKTAKPIWDKITKDYDNVKINGKKLNVISLDCTDENTTCNEFDDKTIEKILNDFKLNSKQYNVEGYPTIIMVDSSNNIVDEFKKNVTYANIEQFINENM
jgi:thiol-disulfide isomerase/thioredoxin